VTADSAYDWLTQRVPMWAVLVLLAATGATTIAGGSWRWLENNEPRLAAFQARLDELRVEFAELKETHGALRAYIEGKADRAEIVALNVRVDGKVDNVRRIEMYNEIDARLNRLEKQVEANGTRLERLQERLIQQPGLGGFIPPGR
jgi:hypothetical protein